MTTSGWLLAVHLIGAAAMVSAIVLFSAVIAAAWSLERPSAVLALFRVARAGDVLITAGSAVTVIFGVALAFDEYSITDGWILAALVLFAILAFAGQRSGTVYYAVRDRARELAAAGDDPSDALRASLRSSRGLLLHTVAAVAALAILLDMIFKPGAG